MWHPVSVVGALGNIEDVADLLGVAPPEAERLIREAGFSKPVGEFRGSISWRLDDVERWAQRVGHVSPEQR